MFPNSLDPTGNHRDTDDEDGLRSQIKHRSISYEDEIKVQIGRIAYLRSAGMAWSEAVYQLRDMIVGLEDEEFYDGIPDKVRQACQGNPEKLQHARERYEQYGWEGYPCRAYRRPNGQIVYQPTPENLSTAFRIIMRLLARKGILWRQKRRTRFSPFGEVSQDDREEST